MTIPHAVKFVKSCYPYQITYNENQSGRHMLPWNRSWFRYSAWCSLGLQEGNVQVVLSMFLNLNQNSGSCSYKSSFYQNKVVNWTNKNCWFLIDIFLNSNTKNNIEVDMNDCYVGMTSYSNFVTDKPKIPAFSILVRILVWLSWNLVQGSIFGYRF